MNLYEKLLEMQKKVDGIIKDAKNTSDRYDFASDENVLDRFRPMMDEMGILLIPEIAKTELHEGTTKSGTSRFMTEVWYTMKWHDVESGEELIVPWYAQGVDLAGEKGVGKAATYAEKYFFLKFFHVPTKRDDPDSDGRTGSGEKRQRGTAAAKENAEYYRKAIPQMLAEIYGEDSLAKIQSAYIALTKSDARGYAGVNNIEAISDMALPVVYGKVKKNYEKRLGKAFVLDNGGNSEVKT